MAALFLVLMIGFFSHSLAAGLIFLSVVGFGLLVGYITYRVLGQHM